MQDLFAERIATWLGPSAEFASVVAAVSSVVLIIVVAPIVDQLVRMVIEWLVSANTHRSSCIFMKNPRMLFNNGSKTEHNNHQQHSNNHCKFRGGS